MVVHGGEGGRAIPATDANFHRDLLARPHRTSLRPLDVVQPEGPSWTVDGTAVAWEGWRFNVGFSWREGLILHDVRFADAAQGGRERPVLWRAALAEIIVPYGEPREPFHLKCAYDIVGAPRHGGGVPQGWQADRWRRRRPASAHAYAAQLATRPPALLPHPPPPAPPQPRLRAGPVRQPAGPGVRLPGPHQVL